MALCCMLHLTALAQIDSLRIHRYLEGKRAVVGMALLCDEAVFTYGNQERYPLMSVFKFHVAVAALQKMEEERIDIDRVVPVDTRSFDSETYSPLYKKFPNCCVRLSYRELITYTVSLSDNNTCDLLIDFVGGTDQVDARIRSLGISHFGLAVNEKRMHQDQRNCSQNWSTPLAMASLLRKVFEEPVLSEAHTSFLLQILLDSPTGATKLKAGLPAGVSLAHKTGQSGRTSDGKQIADNDAGILFFPSGRKAFLVVFVKDSYETNEANAALIAGIARMVSESMGETASCSLRKEE